jgi:hypothetical protein
MGTEVVHIINKYGLTLNKPHRPTEIANLGRDDLPELFNELGYTVGAEIGVQRGLYSEVLCQGMPNLTLYCVDSWKAYSGYRGAKTQSRMDSFYEIAQERLAPYNCRFVRKFSMDALAQFEDDSLDFVYIDGNHRLPWVLDDICGWMIKVRAGGIVAGHDYYVSKRKNTHNHSKYAVDCVTGAFRIDPWFLVGLKKCPPEQKRDQSRSWFWVRE